MISSILIILAAICKAIVDTISHHYYESVFSTFNPKFWNPEISWMNKGKGLKSTLFVAITDAWHLFGLLERVFIILAAYLCSDWIFLFIIYGLFISTFHIFYTYIFKR